MGIWTVEYGTLWAVEPQHNRPPLYPAKVATIFCEVGLADVADLAVAMNLPNPDLIEQRLQNNRRCFILKSAGQIVCYGWVTHGVEDVGELERQFYLLDEEAYIWHCGTVPAWREQHCYSSLLSHLIYQLHDEGVPRIWIGASRLNQPSVQGFVNAGFQPVVEVTYRRFFGLTLLWIHQKMTETRPLVAAAYRIILNPHERRLGRLAIGYKRIT
ncbi:MAG: hypothetical protein KJ063_13995 [Anaerolineae bacterium]|nr:hypothetical protein [Anaerolineae bacterium]